MTKRREFLRLATTLAAAGPALLSEAIHRAMSIPAASPTGTIQDVQHVVILMQENRSFDHYFGAYKGVRGFGDPRPVPIYSHDDNNAKGGPTRTDPVWRQPHSSTADGHVFPYPLHPQPPTSASCFAGLPHDWGTGHEALNHGRNDRWAMAKSPQIMAYYQRADIPFHHALADAFTICDAYHCSMSGPTHPNRMFLWTGTNGAAEPKDGKRINNSDKFHEFAWTTYPERLQQAGISWQLYQNSLANNGKDQFGATNAGLNALQWFKNYDPKAFPDSPLVARGNAVRSIDDLRDDVKQGRLPQVSWVIPPGGCCEHPQFPPAYGATFLAKLLDALTANPEVWSSTVLMIMYDENDGFFDHMPPPMPPSASGVAGQSTVDATDEIHKNGQPYGLGMRVPMIIVSPWSRGGWVCSQVFDHTSVIRFLETRFGVAEPNISAWRRAVCGDLTAAFDFAHPSPATAMLPDTSSYMDAHPSTKTVKLPPVPETQAMAVQPVGSRPARAVPYELFADARLDPVQKRLWIDFANTGKVGAVFQVYCGQPGEAPRFHTIEAGKTLTDSWKLAAEGPGPYEITVYGPNGFLRCFRGDLAAAGQPGTAIPEVKAAYDAIRGALVLSLRNTGGAPCVLTVAANAYVSEVPRTITVAPGAVVEDRRPLDASRGWYDVNVIDHAGGGFLRRYAGHVETGVPSVTDLAMGAVIRAAPFDGMGI